MVLLDVDLQSYEVLILVSTGEVLTKDEALYGLHPVPPDGIVQTLHPDGGGPWKRHLNIMYNSQAETDAEIFAQFVRARGCQYIDGPHFFSNINAGNPRKIIEDFFYTRIDVPRIIYYVGHTINGDWFFSYRKEHGGKFIFDVLTPSYIKEVSRPCLLGRGGPMLILEAPNTQKWMDMKSKSYVCVACHGKDQKGIGGGFSKDGSPLTRFIIGAQPFCPPRTKMINLPLPYHCIGIPRFDVLWCSEIQKKEVSFNYRGTINPDHETDVIQALNELYLANITPEESYMMGVFEIILDKFHILVASRILQQFYHLITQEEKKLASDRIVECLRSCIDNRAVFNESARWNVLFHLRLPIPQDIWKQAFDNGANRDLIHRLSIFVGKDAVEQARKSIHESEGTGPHAISLLTRLWLGMGLPANLKEDTLNESDAAISLQIIAQKNPPPSKGYVQRLLIRFPDSTLVQMWGLRALKEYWDNGSETCALVGLSVLDRKVRLAAADCVLSVEKWPLEFVETTVMVLIKAFAGSVLEVLHPLSKLLFRQDVRNRGISIPWKLFLDGIFDIPRVVKQFSKTYKPEDDAIYMAKAFTLMQLYPVESGCIIFDHWKLMCEAVGRCHESIYPNPDKDPKEMTDVQCSLAALGEVTGKILIPLDQRKKKEVSIIESEETDEEGSESGKNNESGKEPSKQGSKAGSKKGEDDEENENNNDAKSSSSSEFHEPEPQNYDDEWSDISSI